MKHQIPLGTKVSFKGDASIVVVDCYQTLIGPCPPDCRMDHDHYEQAYVCVRQESWTARPLADLQHIFDQPDHSGRLPTLSERTPVHE